MIFPEIANQVLYPDSATPSTPQERLPLYQLIVNELNFLLQMSRRTFAWTFPLPMSQLQQGQCEFAFTYFDDATASVYRIVLNQPLEVVLYKK